MSLRDDGSYCCDRCGADVGNGGVHAAVVISDLDPATGNATPRVLHLCRDRDEPDPDGTIRKVQGCRDRVLTKKALANYTETRTTPA